MNRLGFALMILAIAMMLGGNALAQNVGDNTIYFVTYYSNANTAGAPDQTVRIINDGDTSSGTLGNGNLWAAIYVFDDNEELQTCCACFVSPDGLLSESVNEDLTAFAITGKLPTRGVIKVISSSSDDPTAPVPTPGLREWATHVQHMVKGFAHTEAAAAKSNLSASEQALLGNLCYYDALLSGVPCLCTPEDQDF